MQKRYLALDLGSTYTKCALLDENGVLKSCQKASPPPIDGEDGARYEIDVDEYMRQAEELLMQMRDSDTVGVLISTQMHGFVLADAKGRPLTPYISWQDRVGERNLPWISAALGREATRAAGVPLKANLALCALLGRVREGLRLPGNAWFHTLGGYLIFRLTGEHVCHMTNAAPTGLADVRAGGWNRALLRTAGLDGLALPRIECALAPVGKWRGLAVYPDLGDQQACALGAQPGEEDALCVAMGTTGLMGILTRQWGQGEYENRPWLSPGIYLRTVSALPGGRDMEAVKRFVQSMAAAVMRQAPSDDAVWDFLCRIPEGHPGESQSAWQIARGTPAQFVLSLYEEVAEKYEKAAARMGIQPRRLAFIGGVAAKNAALRSAILRRFPDRPMNVCETMDGMRALAKRLNDGGTP